MGKCNSKNDAADKNVEKNVPGKNLDPRFERLIEFTKVDPRAEKVSKLARKMEDRRVEKDLKQEVRAEMDRIHEAEREEQEKAHETRLQERMESEEAFCYDRLRAIVKKYEEIFARVAEKFGDQETATQQTKMQYRRERLKHAKMLVKEIEEKNKLHVIIFRSTSGDWWKLGGNSMLIYMQMIGNYLDRSVRVNPDRDNFGFFANGVICLQNRKRIDNDIIYANANLTYDSSVDFGVFKEYIAAYRLKVPLSEREIRRFGKLGEEATKNINNAVFATAPDLELNRLMRKSLDACQRVERHLDSNVRQSVKRSSLEYMADVYIQYYLFANSTKRDNRRYDYLKNMCEYTGKALAWMALYSDLCAAGRTNIAQATVALAEFRERLTKQIEKMERKNVIGEKLEEGNAEDPVA